MRGRDHFARFRGTIKLTEFCFGCLPRSLRMFIWHSLDCFNGRVALGLRYCLLRTLAKRCGEVVYVGPQVDLHDPQNIEIGDRVSIHRGCSLFAEGGIIIGDDVSIAHQSSLISFDHKWDDPSLPIRDNPTQKACITIANDVWLGCGVRVLAGVNIGSRCIVAAGSVVNKPLESHSVYGGIPAKKLKSID